MLDACRTRLQQKFPRAIIRMPNRTATEGAADWAWKLTKQITNYNAICFYTLYCDDNMTNKKVRFPMELVNFNEQDIIANGAKIYDQRAKIEAIADSIVDNGFDLLLFTSSGGSQAMLDPFAFYIRHMSRLPVENVLSANLLTGDCNRITDKTVAFLTRSPATPPRP